MLFFKVIIAAVLAATISTSPVQDDQPVTREVLQRRFVEFTPIIKQRLHLKTRDSAPGPSPGPDDPPTCHPCDDSPGCC
ncbi:uncharacterized protein MELLADRAFT_89506 [Melampsora larici-populina 98AG31]|uniref:Secreted protein n=1 Tax=Melampsora larici-populina (strain 98AG31 / pathotype 3-4-7) TaxID=747676 RepID=F4RTL3_MELLP|nr:uncharacterized protein MELLADRAFT_89506 [Melampsora larici-populina 98AG31]EGG04277.1 secreted protein [Melampsora larici-populina 98AG31]